MRTRYSITYLGNGPTTRHQIVWSDNANQACHCIPSRWILTCIDVTPTDPDILARVYQEEVKQHEWN